MGLTILVVVGGGLIVALAMIGLAHCINLLLGDE